MQVKMAASGEKRNKTPQVLVICQSGLKSHLNLQAIDRACILEVNFGKLIELLLSKHLSAIQHTWSDRE